MSTVNKVTIQYKSLAKLLAIIVVMKSTNLQDHYKPVLAMQVALRLQYTQ